MTDKALTNRHDHNRKGTEHLDSKGADTVNSHHGVGGSFEQQEDGSFKRTSFTKSKERPLSSPKADAKGSPNPSKE